MSSTPAPRRRRPVAKHAVPVKNERKASDKDRNASKPPSATAPSPVDMGRAPQWIALACASGACAAFNGVFAKLTTTKLTGTLASSISQVLGFSKESKIVEWGIRAMFFGLNLVFNGIMWTLFTRALTRSPSTTRVSILNTSTNFMLTALLGLAIFSEALPPLWWVGAAFLVGGCVLIGKRDKSDDEAERVKDGEEEGGEDEELLLLGEDERRDEEEDEGKSGESEAREARGVAALA